MPLKTVFLFFDNKIAYNLQTTAYIYK